MNVMPGLGIRYANSGNHWRPMKFKHTIFWLMLILGAMLLLHYSSSENPTVSQVSFCLLIALLVFAMISDITRTRKLVERYFTKASLAGSMKLKFYKMLLLWLCFVVVMYILQYFLQKHGLSLKDLDGWFFWVLGGIFGVVMLARKNITKVSQK